MSNKFEYPSQQEVLNLWLGTPPEIHYLSTALDALDKKYAVEGYRSDEFFDEVEAIAERFDLDFVHPKYTRGLSVVSDTTTTVH